jgi:hypothetical protein
MPSTPKLLSMWAPPAAPDLAGLILPAEGRFHLETAAKSLKLPERVLADFSKCALKLLDNQADFDSAIRRFESSRPNQESKALNSLLKRFCSRAGFWAHLEMECRGGERAEPSWHCIRGCLVPRLAIFVQVLAHRLPGSASYCGTRPLISSALCPQ